MAHRTQRELPRGQRKCLTPDCRATKLVSRGLCNKCYVAAGYLIRKGLVTWDDLERRGCSLPKQGVTNKKRRDWFLGRNGQEETAAQPKDEA